MTDLQPARHSLILYHLPISLYSAKVRFALALQGVTVAHHEPPGGSYRSADYRAQVPAGTVPALIDGDLLLTESDSIIEYVDETRAATKLIPLDPRQRARVRMLSRYHDIHLEPCVRAMFPRLDMEPTMRAPSADEISRLSEKLALLETSADADGPFLAGATASMADCGLAASYAWLATMPDALGFKIDLPPRLCRMVTALETSTSAGPEAASYRNLVRHWIEGRSSKAI
jgi:glutathione S-transferase